MPMLSNALKVEKAIAEMPFGSWIDIRNLSKDAQLSIYILSRYLTQERRKCLVERKLLPNGYGKRARFVFCYVIVIVGWG